MLCSNAPPVDMAQLEASGEPRFWSKVTEFLYSIVMYSAVWPFKNAAPILGQRYQQQQQQQQQPAGRRMV
jgi:hypothetical protein